MRVKRQGRGAGNTAPRVLYSLTGEQASVLREAAEKGRRGLYVGAGSFAARVSGALVDGGAAEYREERQTSDTPSLSDPSRMCAWTDYYLVPTAYGLGLLNGCSAKGEGRQ